MFFEQKKVERLYRREWDMQIFDVIASFSKRQGTNARKVISEVYAFFVLQSAVYYLWTEK